MNIILNIKNQLYKLWDWIKKNPKKTYTYVMIILILSFGFSFFQYFYFSSNLPKSTKPPSFYVESDQINSKNDKREFQMENIVKELQEFKEKRKSASLSKNDSLRIEYLYNQYQNLKNAK